MATVETVAEIFENCWNWPMYKDGILKRMITVRKSQILTMVIYKSCWFLYRCWVMVNAIDKPNDLIKQHQCLNGWLLFGESWRYSGESSPKKGFQARNYHEPTACIPGDKLLWVLYKVFQQFTNQYSVSIALSGI